MADTAAMNNKSSRGQTNCNTRLRDVPAATCAPSSHSFHRFDLYAPIVAFTFYADRHNDPELSLPV